MSDRGRSNVMIMADMTYDGQNTRVRLKDISDGGAKVVVNVPSPRLGAMLQINLPNIGWVRAMVAWVQNGMFGIAFVSQIDPTLARRPVTGCFTQPREPVSSVPLRSLA
jgi:hypothetical protein